MEVFSSLDAIPANLTRTVLAIGNFDGVHRGHQEIIEKVRERARLLGAQSVAVTFDPHPVRLLRPAQAPRLITPLPMRLDLLEQTGIEATVVIPFTDEFSRLSAHDLPPASSMRRFAPLRFMRGTLSGSVMARMPELRS